MNETEIAKICTELLNLPPDSFGEYWDIKDTKGNLVLVSYITEKIPELFKKSTDFDSRQLQNLLATRGIIIDYVDKVKICNSYGYTPTMIADKIPLNDDIIGEDTNGLPVTIDIKTAVLKTSYDGALLRVCKYKGDMIVASHNKIDTSSSRFRGSDNFLHIFKKFFMSDKIQSIENIKDLLFDSTKSTSNIIYVFILCDPKLQNSTRYPVGAGFLVYISMFMLDYNRNDEDIEFESNWVHDFTFLSAGNGDPNKRPYPKNDDSINGEIYVASEFSPKIANEILRHGYYDVDANYFSEIGNPELRDNRLLPGESIICEYNGSDIIRITPRSAKWRMDVLDNTNNFYHQFVNLLDYASTGRLADNLKFKYNDLFPEVVSKKNVPPNKQYANRLANINSCFQLAVPYFMIKESKKFMDQYMRDIKELTKYISDNFIDLSDKAKQKKFADDNRFGKEGRINSAGKAITQFFVTYNADKDNDNNDSKILRHLQYLYGTLLYALFKMKNEHQNLRR